MILQARFHQATLHAILFALDFDLVYLKQKEFRNY